MRIDILGASPLSLFTPKKEEMCCSLTSKLHCCLLLLIALLALQQVAVADGAVREFELVVKNFVGLNPAGNPQVKIGIEHQGQVGSPGPTIRVDQGDFVIIRVTNKLYGPPPNLPNSLSLSLSLCVCVCLALSFCAHKGI